jgi:hypothetical protein
MRLGLERSTTLLVTAMSLLACSAGSSAAPSGGKQPASGGSQAVAMAAGAQAVSSAGVGATGSAGTRGAASGSNGSAGVVSGGSGDAGSAAAGGGTGRSSANTTSAGAAAGMAGNGAAGQGVGMPTAGTGAVAPMSSRENDLGDCSVAALPDSNTLPAIAKLPDPFKQLDGTRISTKAAWHCRQAEIRKQAEKYAYGTKPPKPQSVTGTITNTNITVKVMDNGKSTSFSAAVVLPSSGSAPYPAIIVYGGLGLGFGAPMDSTVINGEGIALINYDVGVAGKEGTPRNNKQGAFYDIAGSDSSAGLLVAWSWGASRMIDVIEQSDGKLLKADAIAVTGCSRFGKGAFAAGAFDERIPLTMPIESGTGGVPIWRGIAEEGAQTLSSAYSEQPWFGDAFNAFTGSPTKAPIDTHEMIGLIAPRGLFIMDNPTIANLGPKAAHVAALAGAEIYKALGAGDNISYYSDVQNGTHCSMRPEWSAPLKSNIRKFLKKTGSDPGVIKAAASATGDVSKWIDWTTPQLN